MWDGITDRFGGTIYHMLWQGSTILFPHCLGNGFARGLRQSFVKGFRTRFGPQHGAIVTKVLGWDWGAVVPQQFGTRIGMGSGQHREGCGLGIRGLGYNLQKRIFEIFGKLFWKRCVRCARIVPGKAGFWDMFVPRFVVRPGKGLNYNAIQRNWGAGGGVQTTLT